jgi:hypothetical protein
MAEIDFGMPSWAAIDADMKERASDAELAATLPGVLEQHGFTERERDDVVTAVMATRRLAHKEEMKRLQADAA